MKTDPISNRHRVLVREVKGNTIRKAETLSRDDSKAQTKYMKIA